MIAIRRISRSSAGVTESSASSYRLISHHIFLFQEELRSVDLMKDARLQTAAYLPSGLIDKYAGPPPIAFAIFEPDGKANQEIVVVDLYFATLIDLVPFLAHEAHHYYKGQITKLHRPDPDSDDYPLVRSIAQLQTEGVADLIDKRRMLETVDLIDSTDSWYARSSSLEERYVE